MVASNVSAFSSLLAVSSVPSISDVSDVSVVPLGSFAGSVLSSIVGSRASDLRPWTRLRMISAIHANIPRNTNVTVIPIAALTPAGGFDGVIGGVGDRPQHRATAAYARV